MHSRVKIDLPKLAANLGSAEGKTASEEDVREFLTDNDFIEQPEGSWLCEDISLDLLERSEILAMERAD